jgi:hypothetical protein
VREEDFGQGSSHQPSSKREHGLLDIPSRQSSLVDKYAISNERCWEATECLSDFKRNGPNHVRLGWSQLRMSDDALF